MRKTKWKLLSAGVFLCCVCGAIAFQVAWATPGQSITTTILAGPSELEEIQVVSQTPDHGVILKTRELSDVYVVLNRIAPGGHTGWHSHPGPSIISVVSGEATEYHGDEPHGVVHAAGTAFLDDGDGVHIVRNEGSVELVLIAFQILPEGATRRIDEPAP
jgi:quercetin dioxygenase-like cupin family protein